MGEPRVPRPGGIVGACGQANWACYGDVEHVQSAWTPWYLRKQAALLVAYAHHAFLHKHLEAAFIELADGDDVGGEAR